MSYRYGSPDITSLKSYKKNLNSVDYTNKKDRVDR